MSLSRIDTNNQKQTAILLFCKHRVIVNWYFYDSREISLKNSPASRPPRKQHPIHFIIAPHRDEYANNIFEYITHARHFIGPAQ